MREKSRILRVNYHLYLLVIALCLVVIDDALNVVFGVVLGALVVNNEAGQVRAEKVETNEYLALRGL